jgi:hypothetical protein
VLGTQGVEMASCTLLIGWRLVRLIVAVLLFTLIPVDFRFKVSAAEAVGPRT